MELDIERAHWSLAPRRTRDEEGKPRPIIIWFLSYRTKAEFLHMAWGRKGVSLNGRPIYFDHDYPPAVLQKWKEYSEAKRVLKQRKISFQTPYPAKLRVFYENGTQMYRHEGQRTRCQHGHSEGNVNGTTIPSCMGNSRQTEAARDWGRTREEH